MPTPDVMPYILLEILPECDGQDMAESAVHRSMKAIARAELERDGYEVVEEPLFPPGRRVSWSSYRPDLLGYRREADREEVVLVECETRPNMKRLERKNHGSVFLQSFLFRASSIRRILAVPQGRLGAVDTRVRREWEVWVVGRNRLVQRTGTMLVS